MTMSNLRRYRRRLELEPDQAHDCSVCEALGRGDQRTALAAFHGVPTRCSVCGTQMHDVRDLAPDGRAPVYGGECPRCNDVRGSA